MLEELESIPIDETAFRLASTHRFREALADLDITPEEAIQTIDLLQLSTAEDATLLLDAPFDENSRYTPRATRFSDGTWRVFYSALEAETARTERAHWCRKEAQSTPPQGLRFYFQQLRCRVNTLGYDVRPKREEWPFLTGDATYPQCHALAEEVKVAKASAMLCPSARHPNGTTTPVFSRNALSDPLIVGTVVVEIGADGVINYPQA